jgi:hypothetical protein
MPGIFGRGSQETVCPGGAERGQSGGRQLKTDWAIGQMVFADGAEVGDGSR